MIAPATPDLKIPRRVPLLFEAAGAHQGNRGMICRLDVGFEPMQLQATEGVANECCHSRTHAALLLMARERVIAQIAAQKYSTDDIGQIDDPGQFIRVTPTHQEGMIAGLAQPVQIGAKCHAVRWRADPRSMQRPTAARGLDEGNTIAGLR